VDKFWIELKGKSASVIPEPFSVRWVSWGWKRCSVRSDGSKWSRMPMSWAHGLRTEKQAIQPHSRSHFSGSLCFPSQQAVAVFRKIVVSF